MKVPRILFFTVLLAGSLQAQVISTPLSDAVAPLDGLVYTLPRTQLNITVTVACTKKTPGPFALYAERYLGISDVIQTEQIDHELVDVAVKPIAVPDKTQRFFIKPDVNAKTPTTIHVSPEGFLLGCNLKVEPAPQTPGPADRKHQAPKTTDYQTKVASTFTRDMQQATSTAKLAELAAAQLFNLRETRLNLLQQETEHTPSDGASYRLLLAEINRMEQYYLELFVGTTETTVTHQTLTFDPRKEEEAVLFRFTRQQGVVDKNDLSGTPVLISLTNTYSPSLESMKRSQDKKPKPIGLYYRIPAMTSIKIADDQHVYWEKNLPVPQLGTVATLPGHLTRSVELCPRTGALKKAGW